MFLDNYFEPIVLRESIRARVSAATVSLLVIFTSTFLYIPFLLGQGVTYLQIAQWTGPVLLLMAVRGVLSKRIRLHLDDMSHSQMVRADWMLRLSSIVNQAAVGMGIWIIRSPSPDSMLVPIFITLIVVIWSIGMLANLFSDFPTFIMSMPLLIGQNAAFWLFQGEIGVPIGLSMILSALLMVLMVHRGTAIFRESILMRFEKDQALERVELERQNTQRALREVQAANASKAYFMAAASHDIKQPLQALGLLTDTLLMSDPPKSTVPILKSQRESISQMTTHFEALMDLGRFEGGHFELKPSRFRLGNFAARVDQEIAPLCLEKGLTWKLDMDDVPVHTDEDLLLRLMRNLLTNAVRYTNSGAVTLSAKSADGIVEFVIADTGCGIPVEYQELVFNEFVRLENTEGRSNSTGLGLSIVKKINHALTLDLQMSSTPGEGTRFNFRLTEVIESG